MMLGKNPAGQTTDQHNGTESVLELREQVERLVESVTAYRELERLWNRERTRLEKDHKAEVTLFRRYVLFLSLIAGPVLFGLGFAARCLLKDALR